jgi:hypothetical protein
VLASANRPMQTASAARCSRGHPRAKVFVTPVECGVSSLKHQESGSTAARQRGGLAATTATSRLVETATAKWKRRSLSEMLETQSAPVRSHEVSESPRNWYAVHTRPSRERRTADHFSYHGLENFMPTIVWCDVGRTAVRKSRTFRYFRVTCS